MQVAIPSSLFWIGCISLLTGGQAGFVSAPGKHFNRSGGISDITACEPTSGALCVNVVLGAQINASCLEGRECTAEIWCQQFNRSTSTPTPMNLFQAAHSAEENCPAVPGTTCSFFLYHQPCKHDSEYFVFCAAVNLHGSMLHGSPDIGYLNVFKTFPECIEGDGNECGVRMRTRRLLQFGHGSFGASTVLGVTMLLVYVFWGFLFAKFKFIRALHETGFAVVAGIAAGFLLEYLDPGTYVEFSYSIFGYFVLPLVIFAAGYNLHKQNFLRFINYILALGISGTLFIFIFIYLASSLFEFESSTGDKIHIATHGRLVLAAILSSTDSVAPMAFLPAELYPTVFAVVFGEGVLNDVVAILLADSAGEANSLQVSTVFDIILSIVRLITLSTLMGVAFGLGISLIFKYMKPLHTGALKPAALIILMNYLCYVLAELCEFSAVFSVFLSAVLSGHYASYAMDHEGRHFASETAEMFAYISEAFVFGYFGLTSVKYFHERSFHFGLILMYSCAILAARTCAVVCLMLGLRVLRFGHKLSIGVSELFIIGFAGCMRGTIAYALILKNTPALKDQNNNDRLMVSTVLGIVLVNCLVFGGLFPLAMRCAGLKQADPELDASCEFRNPNGPRRAQTVGFAPRGLAPSEVREKVAGAWERFDGNWMQPMFRPAGDHGHSGAPAGDSSLQELGEGLHDAEH